MSPRTLLPLLGLLVGFLSCATTTHPSRAASLPARGAALLIRGARIFDGERVLPKSDVLIAEGRIVKVGASLHAPPGVEILDASGHTLLPGLIDAHIHVWNEHHLVQAAVFGVTTVLDMMSIDANAATLRASSCTARRMHDTAAHLVDRVIPHVPIRQ